MWLMNYFYKLIIIIKDNKAISEQINLITITSVLADLSPIRRCRSEHVGLKQSDGWERLWWSWVILIEDEVVGASVCTTMTGDWLRRWRSERGIGERRDSGNGTFLFLILILIFFNGCKLKFNANLHTKCSQI